MTCKCGNHDLKFLKTDLNCYDHCLKCNAIYPRKKVQFAEQLKKNLKDPVFEALLIEKIRSNPEVMGEISKLHVIDKFDKCVNGKIKQHNRDFNEWSKG